MGNITEAELMQALITAEENQPESVAFTGPELCELWECGANVGQRRVRQLVKEGKLKVTKEPRRTVTGVTRPQFCYERTGK